MDESSQTTIGIYNNSNDNESENEKRFEIPEIIGWHFQVTATKIKIQAGNTQKQQTYWLKSCPDSETLRRLL